MNDETFSSRPAVAGAVGGYEYQWLLAWQHVLELLGPDGDTIEISVENPSVDLVDDVVIRRRNSPGTYYQIKFSVDAKNPIDEAFFTSKKDGGKSFLLRLSEVFDDLAKSHAHPKLVLYTNRPMDPTHPVLKLRDAITGCLGVALRRDVPVATQKNRTAWAKHIGKTQEELCVLLDHFRIEADGRSEVEFEHTLANLMESHGLTRDVEKGKSIVRNWVRSADRHVQRKRLLEAIEKQGLRASLPAALLVIQAIDFHADAVKADASVDWVDLFEGDSPKARRQLKNPTLWNERLYKELENACKQIEATRKPRVVLRGASRLSTAFLMGQFLPDTRGFQLEWDQHGITWSTMAKAEQVEIPEATVESFSRGDDLAVSINVIHEEFEQDVRDYIRESTLPIRTLLSLRGSVLHNRAIVNDSHANGFVQRVRARINSEVRTRRPSKVHLFMAVPFPVALFLGHLWNRMPSVQLYEEQPSGYAPTFFVPA